MNENDIQRAVFDWARLRSTTAKELELMFHVPNEGKRSYATGAIMKRAGLKSGVPDIFLPVPRNGKNGLWIELKNGRKKPTGNQIWWLINLAKQGYTTCVCDSVGAAVSVISDYLDIQPYVTITEKDLNGVHRYE